jgi:hypothetical protein
VLPADVPLSLLSPLLSALLQHSIELCRNLAVVRSLRKAENLSAREEVVKGKQQRVLLTSDRACCLCHKRIGSSVLVAYPNSSLAHYMCHQRSGASGAAATADAGVIFR